MKHITYGKAQTLTEKLTSYLTEIYFEGDDKKKLSAEEMLYKYHEFIQDTWEIMINQVLRSMEEIEEIVEEIEEEKDMDR